jgi:hypothetical protein
MTVGLSTATYATVLSTTAADLATVETAGPNDPIGGTSSTKIMYVAGTSASIGSAYSSTQYLPAFAVIDFSAAAYLSSFQSAVSNTNATIGYISSPTLTLYDRAATINTADGFSGSTAPGPINVYIASNTTASVATVYGSAPYSGAAVNFNAGVSPEGIVTNGQLGTLTSLGTFNYTPGTTDGQAVNYTLTPSTAGEMALLNAINNSTSGSLIRLVLTPGSTTTAAAFGGSGVAPYLPPPSFALSAAAPLLGDANLDGKVDLTDLNIVLNNLGTTTSLRSNGNFDGAATIDLTDLNDVLNNLGVSVTSGSAIVATPEPASLMLLCAAMPLLWKRRRIG